ncbi:MAG TPA: STAS/SEC14 domain-containing protein [Gemmataceae bacterium]|nr:STAS/SEC14 domain-containing protein [Gemmataceae bacterium]
MAVDLHEEAAGKILVVNLSGKLTKEDYKTFVPHVERLIAQNGKVRLLVQMHDFHGWDMGGLWEDFRFDWKHFGHIERLALVGEKRWEAGMATFCRPFTKAAIRYFDLSDATKASEWIHEGLPASTQAAVS